MSERAEGTADAAARLLAVFDQELPARVNPHADAAVRHLDEWIVEQGVVRDAAARERFARADFGRFAAVTYPTADEAGVCLVADWFAWLFLLDDQLDDGGAGSDPERANALLGMLLGVVTGDGTGPAPTAPDAPGEPAPPIVTSMLDIWRRTVPGASIAWRQRLIEHAGGCVLAAKQEAANRAAGVVPGEAEYIEMRRHTGAIYVCMDLIEIVERVELPAEVYADGTFARTLNAACDVVCWVNDVFSLDKETALGEVHNLVTVVQHARGTSQAVACADVVERVLAEVKEFRDGEAATLARWPEHAETLSSCLAGMRSWMRGNLDWSISTRRYRDAGGAEFVEPSLVEVGPVEVGPVG